MSIVSTQKKIIIGIDASNLRGGGGLTHITELLSALNMHKHNIHKVIIWGSEESLNQFNHFPWLKKICPKGLNHSLFSRLIWQKFHLSNSAQDNNCDLIFSPGGSIFCNFRPIVTMSQNMLPFEWHELKRYGISWLTLRLLLLRWIQSRSFRSADGIIFLTDYAKKQVTKVLGEVKALSVIIPHGINPRFRMSPKKQHSINEYNSSKLYRILYVSIIDHYKHQWNVVEAVSRLKKEGYPVALNLVGPSYPSAKNRLEKSLNKFDVNNEWAKYSEMIPYLKLHNTYKDSHLGVFASSCENLPIILLENMASGLPIACSNTGPMPEVLGSSGLYFNPESPVEIYHAIKKLIDNVQLRSELSQASFYKSQNYTWDGCSFETFSFLEEVFLNHQN